VIDWTTILGTIEARIAAVTGLPVYYADAPKPCISPTLQAQVRYEFRDLGSRGWDDIRYEPRQDGTLTEVRVGHRFFDLRVTAESFRQSPSGNARLYLGNLLTRWFFTENVDALDAKNIACSGAGEVVSSNAVKDLRMVSQAFVDLRFWTIDSDSPTEGTGVIEGVGIHGDLSGKKIDAVYPPGFVPPET
jgi:hypothetical protein